MSEISRVALFGRLNSLAYKALEAATALCKSRGNPYVELVHWIYQILETPNSDILKIVAHFNVDAARMRSDVSDALDRLPGGATSISDLSPDVENATDRGWTYTTLMFNFDAVRTGTLLVAILKDRHLRQALVNISSQFDSIGVDQLTDDFREITKGSQEGGLGPSAVAPQGRDIFITYRRQDSLHVTGRIFDRLVHEFGKDHVFKDVNSILPGLKDFAKEIENQIRSARVVLAVVGQKWLTAQDGAGKRRIDDEEDFVRIELSYALEAENIPVLPVLVDEASMPKSKDLPISIRKFASCQSVTVRADPEFDRDMDSLFTDIRRWLGGEAQRRALQPRQ